MKGKIFFLIALLLLLTFPLAVTAEYNDDYEDNNTNESNNSANNYEDDESIPDNSSGESEVPDNSSGNNENSGGSNNSGNSGGSNNNSDNTENNGGSNQNSSNNSQGSNNSSNNSNSGGNGNSVPRESNERSSTGTNVTGSTNTGTSSRPNQTGSTPDQPSQSNNVNEGQNNIDNDNAENSIENEWNEENNNEESIDEVVDNYKESEFFLYLTRPVGYEKFQDFEAFLKQARLEGLMDDTSSSLKVYSEKITKLYNQETGIHLDLTDILIFMHAILEGTMETKLFNSALEGEDVKALWVFFSNEALAGESETNELLGFLEEEYGPEQLVAESTGTMETKDLANTSGGNGFLGSIAAFFQSVGSFFTSLFV